CRTNLRRSRTRELPLSPPTHSELLPGDGLHVQPDALVTEGDCKADVARSVVVVHDLVAHLTEG
ncbi:MAG: hypothetical protein QOE94_1351, partial [Mycobacterium sp.]|nr:hypothetical protein [Mycobacterium sp.]